MNSLTLPRYTLGLDVETKDTAETSYLLAIGAVLYDNYALKFITSFRIAFDPNDPEQEDRTESESTITWWQSHMGEGDDRTPSDIAYDLAWGGTTKFSVGMEAFVKFMRQLPKDGEIAIPMKGPDFDYPILRNALLYAGNDYRIHARPLDSSRTVERVCHSLELPVIKDEELRIFWKGPKRMPHVAVWDAGYEGYEAARMYYALHLIKTVGYDETIIILNALGLDTTPNLKELAV